MTAAPTGLPWYHTLHIRLTSAGDLSLLFLSHELVLELLSDPPVLAFLFGVFFFVDVPATPSTNMVVLVGSA